MIVSPSLLSADFAHLADDLKMINESEAQMLHIDVMDGVFVPNISFGFTVLDHIKKWCEKPLDVHLMIVDPSKFIPEVKDLGAEIMNVHFETCTHLHRVVQRIKNAGMKAGVTLNPSTPVCMLRDIVADLDLVMLMSVNPGFAGQKFIPGTIDKLADLKELILAKNSKALIEIDGGVNDVTGKLLADAGADILVAGNYIFKHQDPKAAISYLVNL
ncbi:MAG: ribulose-phosphate 3-epimerase [Muribaculaceae bacterium]|nr:ribulose-phosphate 3-epimerase [Muribaculaceae bacterium]